MKNLISKRSKELSKKMIKSICILKNTFWKYGLESQLKWFKKYIKPEDIHNMIIQNDKLIGYTCLRYQKAKATSFRNYLLFDTLIIEKSFRNKKLSYALMDLNLKKIRKEKKISFLKCNDNLVEFYSKFKWIKLKKKNFKIVDGHCKHGMIYNLKIKNNLEFFNFWIY